MTVEVKGLGKITASKETLNNIAALFIWAEDHFDEKYAATQQEHYKRMGSYQRRGFNDIYEALDAVGYYNHK